MKKLFFFLVILSWSTCFFSCKKETQNSETKYYMSFTANGKQCVFNICDGSLFKTTHNDSLMWTTTIAARQVLTDVFNIDSLSPMVMIAFPSRSTAIFNNESIEDLQFFISIHDTTGSYVFPGVSDPELTNQFFELEITEYSQSANRITGKFRGKLFSLDGNKSILIEHGTFKSTIFQYQ